MTDIVHNLFLGKPDISHLDSTVHCSCDLPEKGICNISEHLYPNQREHNICFYL